MSTRTCLALVSAIALGGAAHASTALDRVPTVADTAWPGTITLNVDATNIGQRIFRVHETVPVKPGPLTLLYPAWLPGKHAPRGPIDKLAGLEVHANGERLTWERDQYNVYAFHVEVPEGVSELELDFQFLSPQSRREGRVVMTPVMMNVQWDAMSLYPAGHNIRKISIEPTITLPKDWHYATALEKAAATGDTVTFRPVTYNVLVDSPMFAGSHYKRFDLAPGAARPVHLNVFADTAAELDASDEQIQAHRAMVAQMKTLYGAEHYDHYEFLFAISDQMSGIGLEHHRSSENGVGLGYFTKWDTHWGSRGLLPHEMNHSWNGKYRRGADLTTANFNVPMGDSLLWVYEGQTQLYGNVVAVRSGLISKAHGFDSLAGVAARYDRGRPGMAWRNIQDTTNDPTIAARAPLPYRNYQMSEDYYSGGQLIWLAVDGKLRALSGGKRSLDDFAKTFFGMDDGDWGVNTYTFADVVAALDGIAHYDWAGFLRHRLDDHVNLADGLASQGWKLVYNATPSDAVKAYEKRRKVVDLTYSLGFSANAKGEISDVLWDGPAFKAGLAPAMTVVAVNGRKYSSEVVKEAVRAAAADGNTQPIELLVKNFDRYQTLEIDYHGGLQYPHLERIKGAPDYLSALYAPLK